MALIQVKVTRKDKQEVCSAKHSESQLRKGARAILVDPKQLVLSHVFGERLLVLPELAQAKTSPAIHAESVSQDAGSSHVEFTLDGKHSSFRKRSDLDKTENCC
jgi:hypothetical protein